MWKNCQKMPILFIMFNAILINCSKDFSPIIWPNNHFCNPVPPDSIPGIKDEWQLSGLYNDNIGYIKTIAIHPEASHVIFAGTAHDFSGNYKKAYLFRSTNYGTTWDTLDYTFGAASHILYDPSRSNIIYMARGGSLSKSNDCGATWRDITGDINLAFTRNIFVIAINPVNTNILYAGTEGIFGGALYKSIDGGKNWKKIIDKTDSITCIAIDRHDPNIIFVATAGAGTVLRSTNRGEEWENTGLENTAIGIHDILIDDNIIYALLDYNTRSSIPGIDVDLGVMKSVDDGKTWSKFNKGLPVESTFFAHRIIKDYNSDDIYIAVRQGSDNGIYKLSIGSVTWRKIGIDWIEEAYSSCDLALCPDGYFLYYGSKGFYRMRLK